MSILLRKLGTRSVALVGIAGDDCVLHAALDVQMRDYPVRVPGRWHRLAERRAQRTRLQLLRDEAKADTTPITTHLAHCASTREH